MSVDARSRLLASRDFARRRATTAWHDAWVGAAACAALLTVTAVLSTRWFSFVLGLMLVFQAGLVGYWIYQAFYWRRRWTTLADDIDVRLRTSRWEGVAELRRN